MFQIDNATASSSLPTPETPGPGGYFTNGNPGLGEPATVVTQDWLNMVQGEMMSIIAAASITPSKTTYNQVLTAIDSFISTAISGTTTGRLLNVRSFTTPGTSTYTPTAGTTQVRVTVKGGGGAGGGPVSTSSGQYSVSGGGASGSLGVGLITSAFSGATITVGAAGAGVSGAPGGPGGSSSFGSLIVAPGGNGGTSSIASSSVLNTAGGAAGGVATGTGVNILSLAGQAGAPATGNASPGIAFGGAGGSGLYGNGGCWGQAASGYGAGGGGLVNTASTAAATGLAGSAGIVIVEEYS